MPAAPVLFAPRSEISWRTTFHKGSTGHRVFLGPNPRPGAAIHYYLPSRVAEGVSASLSILERDGRTLVRSLLMERGAGLHRATWDLRRPAPPNPLATGGSGGGGGGGGQGGGFGLGSGPRALPGVYLVRLKVGDREETLPLRFDDDPRIRASVAERRAQAEALERVAGYLRSLVDARDRLQALRAEALKVREGEGFSGAAQEVRQAVTSLIEKIEALQAKIRARAPVDPEGSGPRPPVRPLGTRALRLYSAIDAVTEAPGRAVRQEMAELAAELREFIREVNEVNARDVTEVNGRIRAAGLGEIKPGESLIPPNK